MGTAGERFRILFVCTANICRSPIAEGLVRLAVHASARPDADRLVVESAGVHGHEGSFIDPGAAIVLRARGGDPTGFRARVLTAPMVAAADLVLTAERDHRTAVMRLHPRAHRSTFTVLEFARLVDRVDLAQLAPYGVVARARSLVEAAASRRGLLRSLSGRGADLPDPYGRPTEEFHFCADQVAAALDRPLRLLLG